jgi:hypothetical protein
MAILRAQGRSDPDAGETYYLHVIDAIETLLNEKRLIGLDEMSVRKSEWETAYRSTRHGDPVHLAKVSPES